MCKREYLASLVTAWIVSCAAMGQPTGCVTEIGHLPVNTALKQGDGPVVRDGIMYHVISTNPSGTDYELIAVDVHDPSAPLQVGSADVPNELSCGLRAAIGLKGSELYVLTHSGLSLYDISTPAAPVLVRTLATVAPPCGFVVPGVAVHEECVVVLSGQVYVIDRALMRIPPPPPPTPPNNPVVRVLAPAGGLPIDVAIYGNTAVVSTSNELHAIDISAPSSSFVRETVPVPGLAGTLAFDEAGRLFIACTFTDQLLESVDPFSAPIALNGVGTNSSLGIAASESLYVTGSTSSGALVHRVDHPSSPSQVGASSPFLCEGVTFLDSTLVAVSRDNGIFFLGVSGCASDPCAADYNGDTLPDVLDFLDFFDDFGACDQQPSPCGSIGDADFNGDTTIDVLDFLDFLDAFGQGC